MNIKDKIASRLIRTSLRISFKAPSALPLPVSFLRQGMELGATLFRPRPEAAVHATVLGGVPCERIMPGTVTHRVILHFHGGAFFAGSSHTHRALGSEMSVRSQSAVYMLDYRRAPENPYPAALDDGLAAYTALLEQGCRPEHIVLGGDSGGCALAVSLAIALRDRKLPLPAGIVMISPFLDLTLSNLSVDSNRRADPMVTAYALRRGANGYRGLVPDTDPRVSPVFADLKGLPPMLLQVGGDEILLDDALLFSERAEKAGVRAVCEVYEGMWHNFQMFNSLLSTADGALDRIAGFAKEVVSNAGESERSAA